MSRRQGGGTTFPLPADSRPEVLPVGEEIRRPIAQDSDLNQTNEQKVDQGNAQDASHRSRARQDVVVHGHQEEQQRVTVMVKNHLTPAASMPGLGRMDGRALDAAGAAAAGCVVELFFGPLVGVPVAVEETDALGRFRLGDLPPGFYSLRATALDGAVAQQWNLRVDAGGECRAQVCLPTDALRTHRMPPVRFAER